jgi:hypothetical protein
MKNKAIIHTKYPLSSIITYNVVTILHFLLGGTGFVLGYGTWIGYFIGSIYLLFSFTEMYVLTPLKVCPNCPYYKLDNSLCISGLNVVSKRFVKEGNVNNFPNRATGFFCPNNLYLASFIIPIIGLIPALIINFSYIVLAIFLGLIVLLAFRFFDLFPKVACGHCRAKNICPNAKAMGLSNK